MRLLRRRPSLLQPVLGAGTADNFSSIDIEPGYQRLCGGNNQPNGALAFVRFRHTDTDLVREARQQDFIRWAKSQYSIGKLVADRDRLLKILGEHSQSDKGCTASTAC